MGQRNSSDRLFLLRHSTKLQMEEDGWRGDQSKHSLLHEHRDAISSLVMYISVIILVHLWKDPSLFLPSLLYFVPLICECEEKMTLY